MKFNNLNELLVFASTMARSKTGKVLQAHVKFKIAYVEFCKRRGVPVSRYAKEIGVAKTTPYAWVELYDQWLAESSESEEVTQPEEVFEPEEDIAVVQAVPIDTQAVRDEIDRLSEILDCIEILETYDCVVYKI